jgi:hypothetical protein
MERSWSNLHMIRLWSRQGLPAAVVMHRCCEHMGWQGPHPTLREIIFEMDRFKNPGPAREASRAAGVATVGSAGPGADRRAET